MIFSTQVGSLTLHAIEDGWYHTDPVLTFPGSEPAAWDASGVPALLRVSFGCFVLVGKRVVMVDSGMGAWPDAPAAADAVAGRMPDALRLLGISPEAVELVVHTHLHADHFGGDRGPDGLAFFPNARFVTHQADVDHFRIDDTWLGERARRDFFPFIEEGRVDVRESGGVVLPGLSVEEAPGHTPGHLSVLVESGGEAVLIGGDVSHHPVQVSHPDWSSTGDVDPGVSARTRESVFRRLADTPTLFAAGHYPRPSIGRIVGRDGPMRWEPLDS